MIRTDPYGQFYFPAKGSAGGSSALRDGTVVDVEGLGTARDGRMQVRIGGHVLVAEGDGIIRPGETLAMRVSVNGGTVFLRPLTPPVQLSSSVLNDLGLPVSPVSAFIVSFLGATGVRFDPGKIRLYLKLAARFPGMEESAAEAAMILDRSGIEPTEPSVARLISLLDGGFGTTADDAGETDGRRDGATGRDLLRAINRKRDEGRQWVIVPFAKPIEGRRFVGSVRFLVDFDARKTIETRVTVKDADRRWSFILADGTCRFAANPSFDSVSLGKFVVYLKREFAQRGMTSVQWDLSGGDMTSGFSRVDLEI